MSKAVEMNGADATAGSIFNRLKIMGSEAPIKAAEVMLAIRDRATILEKMRLFGMIRLMKIKTIVATMRPIERPIPLSRKMYFIGCVSLT